MAEESYWTRHKAWHKVRGLGNGLVVEEFPWVFRFPVFTPEFCDVLTRLADGVDGKDVPLIALDHDTDEKASKVAAELVSRVLSNILGMPDITVYEHRYSEIRKDLTGNTNTVELNAAAFVLQVCIGDDCDGGYFSARKHGETSVRVIRPEVGHGILKPAALPANVSPVTEGRMYDLIFYFDVIDRDEDIKPCDS